MIVETTTLPGVLLIKPDVFGDARGFFQETWNRCRYAEAGLDVTFVQDNLSRSGRGILRGLHFQHPNPQGKLVYVLDGEVFDVAVDIRRGSPTFGRWYGATLSAENHHQLYVPPGFAHGFCVTGDSALFAYKCTDFYQPQHEHSLLWNDPDLDIHWPVAEPILSAKDKAGRLLKHVSGDALPVYGS